MLINCINVVQCINVYIITQNIELNNHIYIYAFVGTHL